MSKLKDWKSEGYDHEGKTYKTMWEYSDGCVAVKIFKNGRWSHELRAHVVPGDNPKFTAMTLMGEFFR